MKVLEAEGILIFEGVSATKEHYSHLVILVGYDLCLDKAVEGFEDLVDV